METPESNGNGQANVGVIVGKSTTVGQTAETDGHTAYFW
jgi:hypothetical protein